MGPLEEAISIDAPAGHPVWSTTQLPLVRQRTSLLLPALLASLPPLTKGIRHGVLLADPLGVLRQGLLHDARALRLKAPLEAGPLPKDVQAANPSRMELR